MSDTPEQHHKAPVITLDTLVAVGILAVIAALYKFAGARTADPITRAPGLISRILNGAGLRTSAVDPSSASENVVDAELERGTSIYSMRWSGNPCDGASRAQLIAYLHELPRQKDIHYAQDASITTTDATPSSFETSWMDDIHKFPLPPKKAVVHDSSSTTAPPSDLYPDSSSQECHLTSFAPYFSPARAARRKFRSYSSASSCNPSFDPAGCFLDHRCWTHTIFGDIGTSACSIPPCEDHPNFDTFLASGIIAHSSPPRPGHILSKSQVCPKRCAEYGYF